MIRSWQQKIWKTGLEMTEKNLEKLINDKNVLFSVAMLMNLSLKAQRIGDQQWSKILSRFRIPTEQTIQSLYDYLYQGEKQHDELEAKIARLETEITRMNIVLNSQKAILKKSVKPLKSNRLSSC